ncbi:hypothetical protein [Streptomyces sp. NBC_00887]|uniref:hypothetical protein n=1 Tax=Streptomyces sp. NBC_00887 TaxID=2975859 RepID=UPI003864DA9E|nr:hypothetical protein OG844_16835 [Streptomyces sp. NBC_00887]
MRKLQKAAVVVAMLGSVGFIGAGTAVAGGHGEPDIEVKQSASCQQHDTSVNVLSNLSALNGVLSGLIGNEGDPGRSDQNIGSQCAAGNDAF